MCHFDYESAHKNKYTCLLGFRVEGLGLFMSFRHVYYFHIYTCLFKEPWMHKLAHQTQEVAHRFVSRIASRLSSFMGMTKWVLYFVFVSVLYFLSVVTLGGLHVCLLSHFWKIVKMEYCSTNQILCSGVSSPWFWSRDKSYSPQWLPHQTGCGECFDHHLSKLLLLMKQWKFSIAPCRSYTAQV